MYFIVIRTIVKASCLPEESRIALLREEFRGIRRPEEGS